MARKNRRTPTGPRPRPAVDPWEVLRRLRAHPLVDDTTNDEPMSGCDAVDALCEIRKTLDAALVGRR